MRVLTFFVFFIAGLLNAFSQRFAVIGDFGTDNSSELAVSELVKSWNPEFIATVGDNNYLSHSFEGVDRAVGKYYHDYIFPYSGIYGAGSKENRFWPCLGNHDYDDEGRAHFDFFSLPGNERYYDFIKGNVHFFVLNSSHKEPDGNTESSVQAQWLRSKMSGSPYPWRVVILHQPPFSSDAVYGSFSDLQWPFREWGASIVLAGHAHLYERLLHNGLIYVINGLGGHSRYNFGTPIPESRLRYNENFGAMLVEARPDSVSFSFYSIEGARVDHFVLKERAYGISENSSALKARCYYRDESLHLALSRETPLDLSISLYSVSGKLLMERSAYVLSGNHKLSFPAEGLSAGLYIVNIRSAAGSGNFKVIVR